MTSSNTSVLLRDDESRVGIVDRDGISTRRGVKSSTLSPLDFSKSLSDGGARSGLLHQVNVRAGKRCEEGLTWLATATPSAIESRPTP